MQRREQERVAAEANIMKQEKEAESRNAKLRFGSKNWMLTSANRLKRRKYSRQQAAEAQLIERQRQAEAELFETQKEVRSPQGSSRG